MATLFLILGSLLAGIAVALGAFGAHALRARLSPERLETFETGVRYQMYHSLGLVAVAVLVRLTAGSLWLNLAGWLFLVGILLFSGSLYLLVSTGKRRWGAVTPLGGVAFIAAWVCLAFSALAIPNS